MSVFLCRPALPVLTDLLSACGQNSVAPEQAAVYSIGAMQLFTQTCADQGSSAVSPAAWAQRYNLQPLTAEAVHKPPAGMMESDAQAVRQAECSGAVFYLSTAPASCSVKTAVADEAAARRAFITRPNRAGREQRRGFVRKTIPLCQLVYTQPDSENGGELCRPPTHRLSNMCPRNRRSALPAGAANQPGCESVTIRPSETFQTAFNAIQC